MQNSGAEKPERIDETIVFGEWFLGGKFDVIVSVKGLLRTIVMELGRGGRPLRVGASCSVPDCF